MDMSKRSLFLALSIISMSILSIISCWNMDVNAAGPPEISIQLHQASQVASVAPGNNTPLVFTGIVQVTVIWSPRIQYIEVVLSYDAGGWTVSGTTILLLTQENESIPFSCTVIVPSGTSSTTIGEFTVSGTWRYEPGVLSGDIDPAIAMIHIDRFFSHELSSTEEYSMIGREDAGICRVKLRNLGNGNDSIRIGIANQDELSRARITSSMSGDALYLEEGETKVVDIAISTSRAAVGTYEIELESFSQEAEAYGKVSEPSSIVIEFMVVSESPSQEEPPIEEEDPPIDDEDPPEEEEEMPELDPDPQKDYEPYVPGEGGSFGPVLIVAIVIAALIVIAIPVTIAIVVFRKRR